ncbi:hypothetical protein Xoosp13_395 [Xanthomonas phage Xoo-sp13]|nr:hypothetical protein Xoosp13_395 [Xanthomonas phage Xoo-sp13]
MCLYVSPGTSPSIAKEAITVYKVLEAPTTDTLTLYDTYGRNSVIRLSTYSSPFRSFPYELDRDYTSEFNEDLTDAPIMIMRSTNQSFAEVGKGIHSLASKFDACDLAAQFSGGVVIECIIKPGIKYFKGYWPGNDGFIESYASESLYIGQLWMDD